MKHEIKSIGVISMMKIHTLMGFVIGLLYGLILFVMMLLGAVSIGDAGAAGGLMVMAIVMAIGVVIAATIGSAIGGALMAIIYNVIAKMIGGIEIEFNDKTKKE
jgi:hypothetical protein